MAQTIYQRRAARPVRPRCRARRRGAGRPWLRQVLMRRTHRRYSDRPVPEWLVRLLLAAAFSASRNRIFSRPRSSGCRTARAATGSPPCSRTCRGSAQRRCFSCFSAMRAASNGSASCAATGSDNGALEGFFNAAGRCRAGAADLHSRGRDAGSRHLPDQRAAQPHRSGRRDPRSARQGFPGGGAVPRLPGAAGFISMRLPFEATVHIDRYDDCGLAAAVDAYDRRRDARHSIKDRQRDPSASAPPNSTAGRRTRRGRRRPRRRRLCHLAQTRGFTFADPETHCAVRAMPANSPAAARVSPPSRQARASSGHAGTRLFPRAANARSGRTKAMPKTQPGRSRAEPEQERLAQLSTVFLGGLLRWRCWPPATRPPRSSCRSCSPLC